MKSSNTKVIQVSSLKLDSRLEHSIYDSNGVLLLAAGSRITGRFLQQLKDRKTASVVSKQSPSAGGATALAGIKKSVRTVSPRAHKTNDTPTTRQLDRLIEQFTFPELSRPLTPPKTFSQLNLTELREQVHEGMEHYHAAAHYYNAITTTVNNNRDVDLGRATSLMLSFSDIVRMDPSIAPLLMDFTTEPYEYLVKQAVNTAILTFSLATSLGYRHDQVLDASIAALVQDLGMLQVPDSIRLANRQLTKEEYGEIKHHPVYTLDLLEQSEAINQTVRIIIYQAHERCDGSGYPRGRQENFIHPLAKLLGVTDTYSAITTEKPFRKARTPYDAMTTILYEAHQGRLDKSVVRGLINYLSLFPIGSRVLLSDGSLAKVIRSNGPLNTRPIVLLLNDDLSESDTEVNLANSDPLRVVEFIDHMAPDPSPSTDTPSEIFPRPAHQS